MYNVWARFGGNVWIYRHGVSMAKAERIIEEAPDAYHLWIAPAL